MKLIVANHVVTNDIKNVQHMLKISIHFQRYVSIFKDMYVHSSTFLKDILCAFKNTKNSVLKKSKSTIVQTDYLDIHLRTFDIHLKTFQRFFVCKKRYFKDLLSV